MNWQLAEDKVLLLRYKYFHIFWLFRITVPGGYSIATATEDGWAQRPLSKEEAALVSHEHRIGLWWRWGILYLVAAVFVVITLSNLF